MAKAAEDMGSSAAFVVLREPVVPDSPICR